MSIAIMTKVWQSSHSKGTERLVLIALADYANDAGEAWPSIGSLSRKVNTSDRNTQYAIANLQRSGELIVDRNAGRQGCNVFRVNLPAGVQPSAPPVQRGSPSSSVEGVKPVAPPNASEGVKPASSGGEAGFVEGVKPVAPEPSLNHQEPLVAANGSRNGRAAAKKNERSFKTPVPADFAISDRVRAWAGRKGHKQLEARLEHFKLTAEANGYRYVSHDAAFMRAISDNWAKLDDRVAGVDAMAQIAEERARRERKDEERRSQQLEHNPALVQAKLKEFGLDRLAASSSNAELIAAIRAEQSRRVKAQLAQMAVERAKREQSKRGTSTHMAATK